MRKVAGQRAEEQRQAMLWLADLGIAVFSSAFVVVVLKGLVDWSATI